MLLALAGCQATGSQQPIANFSPTASAPTTTAPATAQQGTSDANEPAQQTMVQRVQFAEPLLAPAPPPDLPAPSTPEPVRSSGPTLADFEQMALAANPSVARAAALVQAARGNYTQVGLPPNPSVGYEGQQLGSGGLAEQDGIFIQQEFVRGGKL
ncbi:MAG TPA: hypothetical protein VFV87_12575, partial [Pirellulaceae bacterium]|nr:hypothetical protein [Pirellulaceae bacterium]